MARYMLLIHAEEASGDAGDDTTRTELYEEYGKLLARMKEHGHLIEGDELQASGAAKLVRVRAGATQVVDGPFIETKEQLGGYFLVDCDLDDAIAYAAAIPGARQGTVEVRPVVGSESA